jgi:opacity protein-like surface antigen
LRAFGTAALVLVGVALARPALADDQEARAAAILAQNQAQQQSTVGFIKQVGDTKYSWRPYIETEAGIDTNHDNSFSEDGSGFVKLEAGMKATLERAKEYYALTLRGRFIDLMQLDDDTQHRTDLKVGLDTRWTLSPTETLSVGSYFLRDLISPARADIAHSYAEYAIRTDDYRFKLLGKNHTEHNFDTTAQGTDTFDDYVISRPKAFDYSRSDAQVNVLAFTRNMLQPFAIYDFGHIDFYNQVAGASIDRDATEHFAVAGVRLQLNKNFRVDVGYRYNFRDFEDATITRDTNGYIDVNLFWQPLDNLRFTAVIERFFDESTSSFGVVDDVKSYGVTFDWKFEPRWRLAGTTYLDDERALGDVVNYRKITSTLSLTYDVNSHLEVFASGLTKWVDERISDESYDRFKIGTGARLKF